MGLTLIFAGICRRIFDRTLVGGFFLSLIFAGLSLLIFAISQENLLKETTSIANGKFIGPAIDVSLWFVFSVFVAITGSSAIQRMMRTWGMVPRENEKGEKETGISLLEILIVGFIWWLLLSGAQQKILGAFTFKAKPPAIGSM